MDFKLPDIAAGKVVPDELRVDWLKEAREKAAAKEQCKHDFVVAAFGIAGGLVSGVVSSLIVLWIQGLL